MFCRNCGCKNEEEAVFCRECGTKLVAESESSNIPFIVTSSGQNMRIGSFLDSLKQIPQKVLIGIVVAIMAIIIVAVAVANVNSTINFNDYVEVTYEGYDGYGYATVYIDWDEIAEKYSSKISYTNKAILEYGEVISYMTPAELMSRYISVGLSKYDGLSNGDEVEYVLTIDEELSEYLDCKIKYKNQKVVVSGLNEVETFDPFENLIVIFNGVDSDGCVNIEYTGEILDVYDFYCDKDWKLSNGDTIVVYLNADTTDMKYYAENYGKIPVSLEKEYIVEGLGKYVSQISEIDENTMSAIRKQVENIIDSYISGWSLDVGVDSVAFVGNYLEVADYKDDHIQNTLGIIYKIDSHVQASDNYEKVRVTQYYDVRFENVIINQDGTVEINLNNYSTPQNSFIKKAYYGEYSFSYNNYYYYGYKTINDLVQNRADNAEDYYVITWNIDGAENLEEELLNNENYLCPYSSERKLTKREIEEYMNNDYSSYGFPGDRTIIQMLINEIYAMNGYEFSDSGLKDYFEQKEWYADYSNRTNNMTEIYEDMSEVEKENIALLEEYK